MDKETISYLICHGLIFLGKRSLERSMCDVVVRRLAHLVGAINIRGWPCFRMRLGIDLAILIDHCAQ